MRVFWAIVGVLVLVTGGLFLLDPGGGSGDGPPGVASDSGAEGSGVAPALAAREPDGGGEVPPPAIGEPDDVEAPAGEPVIVSTADPEIREVESVEAGLAEMGIVVVETPAVDEAPAGDAAAPADKRDGEQVVIDAIVAQTSGDDADGEHGQGGEAGVESDWLIGEAAERADADEPEAPDVADDALAAVEDGEDPAATDDGDDAVAGEEVAPVVEVASDSPELDSPELDSSEFDSPVDDNAGAEATASSLEADAGGSGAVAGGTVEQREGGGLLIDGKTVVKGAGTEASPYELPWDLLVSASRSYAPEKGKKELPAWARALDGKWVRVRGYVLLPVMAADTKELLVMQNQWDGCCIGVPPSPYDAAEVRLTRSVDDSVGGGGFVNYGTIKGKLDIDPYIVGGWLLGLYVIEGAQIETGSGTKGT